MLRRRCRRHLRLLFSVASHPPARFIVSRLLYPWRRDLTFFDIAFISIVLHRRLIVAYFPALDIANLPRCLLRPRRFPPLVFALLCYRLRLRLPIAPVLLSQSPPLGTWSHRSLLSADCFTVASVLTYKDSVSRGLPRVFLQDQLSGSDFGGTRK